MQSTLLLLKHLQDQLATIYENVKTYKYNEQQLEMLFDACTTATYWLDGVENCSTCENCTHYKGECTIYDLEENPSVMDPYTFHCYTWTGIKEINNENTL